MLKITRIDGGGHATILKLEGRLTLPGLAELDATISACLRDQRRVVIDLAGVGFLDEPGATALRAARNDAVELVGASPFVRELLQEVES
jgi:anti-anti-sigma regulatory factor